MSKNTDLGNLVNGLFVDSSRNVGVGTTSPNINSFGRALTLSASTGYAAVEIYGASATGGGQLDFGGSTTRFASISGEYESSTNGYLNIRTLRAGSMTDAVRITSAGRVGIGTSTSPTYLLEVATASGSQRIRVGTLQNNNNSSTFEAITTAASTTASSAWFRANAGGTMSIGTSTYAKANSDSGNFANLSSEVQTAAINITAGGTVLMNTVNTFSNEKLRVIGSNAFNGLVRFENNVNQTDVNHGVLMICNTANYAIGNDASIGFSLNRADNTAQDPRASIGCKTSSNLGGDLVFNTRNDSNYAERMRILGNGNVGIGNTTPSTKLHVTGTISSSDLLLAGTGDYSYTTSDSWTSWQTIVPTGVLVAQAVYIIRLWYGTDNAPWTVATSFLFSPANTNGPNADGQFAPMISTHQGGTGVIYVRARATWGSIAGLDAYFSGFTKNTGSLSVKIVRLM